MKIKIPVLFFILLFCLESCAQINGRVDTYNKYRTQYIDNRDSILLMATIIGWNKIHWDIYGGDQRIYKIDDSDIHYYIGGVFYSPDKLKVIIWLGTKEPNAESRKVYNKNSNEVNKLCPSCNCDTIYGMSAIIGYRINKNDIWNFYPFKNQIVECSKRYDYCLNVMGQYYFEKMKGHAMWRLVQTGPEAGKNVLSPYGYNLQDDGFWDKCWLWEKETITCKGLYPFQKNGYSILGANEKIGYENNENIRADSLKPPKIEYPKEILALYGK